jgi:ribosomal protein S8
MTFNSNLALLISRLKISVKNKNNSFYIPRSSLNKGILEALYRKGYISSYHIMEDRVNFKVFLKFNTSNLVFNNMRLVSTPSRRIFLGYDTLITKYKPYDFFIVSSSKGIFLGDEVFLYKVGGELLCDSSDYN